MNEEKNETNELTTDHLAMEVLKQQSEKAKADIRGRNIGIVALTAALIAVTIALSIINYKNNVDWRNLFNEYEFVTQDGGGYNNINKGQQGDVNNGTKNDEQEER